MKEETHEEKQEAPKKKKKWPWIVVLILSFCLLVGALLFIDPLHWFSRGKVDKGGVNEDAELPTVTDTPETEPADDGEDVSDEPSTEVPESESTEPEPTEPLPDNRVDWSYYADVNTDIYAWLYLPGAGIDLPILQPSYDKDDDYYLRRDMSGNYSYSGIPFTQKANALDFSDSVTVVYGHNMLQSGVMFTDLLDFRDATFFEENEFFYIYQPQRVLTYRIVSAHVFSRRHILNTYELSTEEGLQEFLDDILSPHTMVANVREGVDVTTESHIVTLETCIDIGGERLRYLVNGVLVDDQPTN